MTAIVLLCTGVLRVIAGVRTVEWSEYEVSVAGQKAASWHPGDVVKIELVEIA